MLGRRYGGLRFAPLGLFALALASVAMGRQPTTAASHIRHVFIIMLENKNFEDTFGNSVQDPYLQKELVPRGALLTHYYGTGHVSLANYISLISGQSPTRDTANDCSSSSGHLPSNFTDVVQVSMASDGQVVASGGCVYPRHVKTLSDQLAAAGYTWKGYMEDMGNDPSRESSTCGQPRIGFDADNAESAEAPSAKVPMGDAYATKHNPFVYFHSIIDFPSICKPRVVNLKLLRTDLARVSTTPNFALITPNLCHDGHDGAGTGVAGTTCANGEPGGLASADAFLRMWVPRILGSSAYKKDGLLIITLDEGNYATVEMKDANSGKKITNIVFPGRSCCGQQPGPNLADIRPGSTRIISTIDHEYNIVVGGFGGDRIGALLLSPFVKAGSTSGVPYNHYSMLHSIEDIFELPEYLGYAADNLANGYHLDSIGDDHDIFESSAGRAPQSEVRNKGFNSKVDLGR